MKIRVKEHRYFGYLQGYKIYIDGVKYPKGYGFFYTELEDGKALGRALIEHRIYGS